MLFYRKHKEAGEPLRTAVTLLDKAIAVATSDTSSARGRGSVASNMRSALSRTLVSLGMSLLAVAGQEPNPAADSSFSDNVGGQEVAGAEAATVSGRDQQLQNCVQ